MVISRREKGKLCPSTSVVINNNNIITFINVDNEEKKFYNIEQQTLAVQNGRICCGPDISKS